MRVLLTRRSSTKAERIFYEMLKRNHIPFEHRVRIEGKEIDFIVANYAIEIDGHDQSALRNHWLIVRGLIPLHYHNLAFKDNSAEIERDIIAKYGLHTSSNRSLGFDWKSK